MFSILCRDIEPSLSRNHRIKGTNIEDLRRNIKSHLRETHPETELTDEEMLDIDERVKERASEFGGVLSVIENNTTKGDEDSEVPF